MKKIPETYSLEDLLAIMTRLRDPEGGCPWDQRQDFKSIVPYTIEEAYEVADAIERGDLKDLKDELGDLLFQVVYHAEMAREINAFQFADVVQAIASKLVRRHPHVFGEERLQTEEEIKEMWERVKAEERADKSERESVDREGLLDDIAGGLPAMARAIKLQARAAKVGFDWSSTEPVFEKLSEELQELQDAVADTADQSVRDEMIASEFGDLLFVMANLARHLKIDPEGALRKTNSKFIARFEHIESHFAVKGVSLDDVSLDEMEALWEDAKRLEREGD